MSSSLVPLRTVQQLVTAHRINPERIFWKIDTQGYEAAVFRHYQAPDLDRLMVDADVEALAASGTPWIDRVPTS
jgi:hypothetical protein